MDARISTGLPGHPKTKKLARRLGAEGPLGCIYLFLWTAANRSNGDLSGMTDEDIELAIDWAGDEGAFVAAMAEVGFIEGAEGERVIHDWAEHNPWAAGAEARSEKSRWAALCKQHGRKEAARLMPEYAARIADASAEGAPSKPAAVPESASGTPRAETGSAPSPSPSPSPSPLPKQERASPTGSRLPDDWAPTDADIEFAERERPDIDWRAEAPKFADHWRAQPGQKGRKSDWPATWRNWIRGADRFTRKPHAVNPHGRERGESLTAHAERVNRQLDERERSNVLALTAGTPRG